MTITKITIEADGRAYDFPTMAEVAAFVAGVEASTGTVTCGRHMVSAESRAKMSAAASARWTRERERKARRARSRSKRHAEIHCLA
jgi:hypothetical protein